MSQHDVTSQVETLLAAGLTLAQINTDSGVRVDDGVRETPEGEFVFDAEGNHVKRYYVTNRRDEARFDSWYNHRSTYRSTRPANGATDRQLDYIRSLIAHGAAEEGGFMSVPADLNTLTKGQASALIDSLTGRY